MTQSRFFFRPGRTVLFLFLLGTSLVFLIPFVWSLLTSLKANAEIYASNLVILPTRVSFEHYIKVFTQMQDFLSYSTNTIVVTAFSVAFTVLFSAMMGYAFSKLDFFGKRVFFAFILIIMTLPYAIYLIPIYILEDRVNLINTHAGLILPYIATNLPIAIFIMQGTFNNIPNELAEAGTIDGCNFFDVWRRVVLPVAAPGVSAVVILTFINVWGEFMFARTLTNSPAAQTLAVGITFLRDEAASWQFGTLCATIVLSLVPLVIVFLTMQRYFIKGITDGALKG
jgi:ABC-type glycerol-3-phosphate transport system permease component